MIVVLEDDLDNGQYVTNYEECDQHVSSCLWSHLFAWYTQHYAVCIKYTVPYIQGKLHVYSTSIILF